MIQFETQGKLQTIENDIKMKQLRISLQTASGIYKFFLKL